MPSLDPRPSPRRCSSRRLRRPNTQHPTAISRFAPADRRALERLLRGTPIAARYLCDFGNVVAGQQRRRTFALTNTGFQAVSFDFDKKALAANGSAARIPKRCTGDEAARAKPRGGRDGRQRREVVLPMASAFSFPAPIPVTRHQRGGALRNARLVQEKEKGEVS